MKHPAVYIMTNKKNGTIYIGVTTNLLQRAYQHKEGRMEGFTKKYGCNLLVYYEFYERINTAISREKQLKSWSRKKKLKLMNELNLDWIDLYDQV